MAFSGFGGIIFIAQAIVLLTDGITGRSIAVMALQLPVIFLVVYAMQRRGELIGRHTRTLRRHSELNAMSAVMMSAEAIDEAQSAVVIAGAALLHLSLIHI